MRFEGLTATPDLMGRRVWLSWSWSLSPLESPGDVPDVLVRRKARDWAFPPLAVPDPYLIHDSAAFPPAPVPGVLAVADLPDREERDGDLLLRRTAVSVAAVAGGVPVERQRRVLSVWRDAAGVPVRVRADLLDADALVPHEPAYYEIDDGSAPGPEEEGAYRAVARPGEVHALNKRLWEMLPEAYKGADRVAIPAAAHVPGVPETARGGGQLRRLMDMFGMGLDALRNGAEGLGRLRDLDDTSPEALALLGRQVGWDPSPAIPLEQRRNEVASASRLFDVVGTVQSLRALVTHQTGWRSQVAEMAQGLARANRSRHGSLQLRLERPGAPGTWRGGADAADVFAFPPGGAAGAAGMPATLLAAAPEPYALAPGHELTLSVDGAAPVRLRFGPDDFAAVGAATAAEVAAVIDRALDDATARDAGGRVEIATALAGTEARLDVVPSRESLLALSASPTGRIAAVVEGDRTRLFYGDREGEEGAARPVLVHKAWGFGEWRDAEVVAEGVVAAGAAAVASGPWLGLAGAEGFSVLRGATRAPEPATIATARAAPFLLVPGSQLTLLTPLGAETFAVNAADYAVPAAATAAEVAAAMTAQLAGATAQARPDGTVRLSTLATGEGATLAVDLAASTAARALGLAARGLAGEGRWDAGVDWAPRGAGPATGGPVADPAAASWAGGAALAWAEHQAGAWGVRAAHWVDATLAATPSGLAERVGEGPWTLLTTLDGLPSDDVRAVLRDAAGTVWAATAAGLGRRAAGVWTALTTLDGLASDDVRALALLPDGRLACAGPAGLSEVLPGGAVAVTAAAPGGLASDDLRALAATPEGDLLCGTALGLSRRDRHGTWASWTVADGLPPGPILAVAGGRGIVVAGSAGGLAVLEAGPWAPVAGLPSPDVRGLAMAGDGAILAATAGGLARRTPAGWRTTTPAEGLPLAALAAVAEGPDRRLLVAGPGGAARSGPGGEGGWTLLPGLPAGGGRGLQGAWSPPVALAAPPGGAREPHLAPVTGGGLWLTHAARTDAVASLRDDWTLRLRRLDPATMLWGPEQALTALPPGGASDREPWIEPRAAGGARVHLSTDRTGGRGLATVEVDAAGIPAAPVLAPTDPAEAWAPAAIPAPGGGTWLVHRSDGPLAPSQLARIPPPGGGPRPSLRVPDAATLSHEAGARAPVLAHLARHAMRHRVGDPMAYTPERPDATATGPGVPVSLHTRRTVAIHMRQAPFGSAVTQEEVARLLQLLNRFKPINLRLRLVIAPDPLTEVLWPPGADIGEAWGDDVPFAEVLGAIGEATAVAIPGLAVLLATDPASLSADALIPATLRRRTWFPDLL